MQPVSIERAYQPVEVDLWGTLFETRDLPKSLSKEAAEIRRQLDAVREDEDDQAVIELFGRLFDIKLAPVKGGRKKPSAVLKEKWDEDKLGPDRLFNFLAMLVNAQQQAFIESLQADEDGTRPS